MVGNTVAYSNDNGLTWTYIESSFPFNTSFDDLTGVVFGNDNFVTVSYFASSAYSTTSGIIWDLGPNLIVSYRFKVAFGNNTFVAVNANGRTWYSNDNGRTWSDANSVSSVYGLFDIAFGNDTFVAVGYGPVVSVIYSGDNGLTWHDSNTATPGVIMYGIAFGDGIFIAVGQDIQMYSTDNGQNWSYANTMLTGLWVGVAYGNGTFVIVSNNNQAYSTDNGLTWNYATNEVYGSGFSSSVTFAYGNFIMVGIDIQAYSADNGLTWVTVASPLSGNWKDVTSSSSKFKIPGDGLRNLLAVGNYIYCSTSNVAVQIDTTQDLSTAAAYKFPAPLPVGQYVFANGPRYVYMFAQGDPAATNIVEFDPYGPDTTFKASILVDYESLPEGVKKPDKALLGLVQTQKVTDMTQMNIKGPVKELWVTGSSDTANVFQYSNLATRSTLEIAGEQIVTDDVGTHTFFNVIEPFEAHTSMPIRNVSVLPFEFDPESVIPNGTVNFSRIRDQIFDGGAETVWARTYNLLAIQGGIGNLMYN
jgi:hypothetical protein